MADGNQEISTYSAQLLCQDAASLRLAKRAQDALEAAENARSIAIELENLSLEMEAVFEIMLARLNFDNEGAFASATWIISTFENRQDCIKDINKDQVLNAYQIFALCAENIPQLCNESILKVLDRAIAFVETYGESKDLVNILHGKSRALLALGKYHEARIAAEESISRKRLQPDALSCDLSCHLRIYAQILYQLGDYREAKRILEDIVTENPEEPEYAQLLAFTLEKLGDFNEAIHILEELVTENPEVPNYANSLAWVLYREQVNLEHAESMARKANQIESSNTSFLQTLMAILIRRDKWPEAGQLFLKYVEMVSVDEIRSDWDEDIFAFADAVKKGRAKDLCAMLESHPEDVWRVIYYALKLADSGESFPNDSVPIPLRASVEKVARQIIDPPPHLIFPDVNV